MEEEEDSFKIDNHGAEAQLIIIFVAPEDIAKQYCYLIDYSFIRFLVSNQYFKYA